MSFCSFASLLGADCGASCENLNVVDFVELKDCTRDVTAHLKSCNILTDVESVNNNERKLLLTNTQIFFCTYYFSIRTKLCASM